MKTAAVLVLVWLASVSAQLQQSGPCPQVPFVRKFDLNKMMGQWYEQIHTQRWSDLELDCNSHLFTYVSNTTFTYDTYARNPTRANQYHKRGNVQLKRTEKGLALDVSEGGDSYDVIIVDTDYTTFATLWTCMPGESSHFENVVVLTRQKFPGLSALLSALDALDARNITRMYLVYTEQRNCPKFTPDPPGAPTSTSPIPSVDTFTTASPSTPLSDSTSDSSNTKAPELPSSPTITVNITVIPPIDLSPTTPIVILPSINPNSPSTPTYHPEDPHITPDTSTESYKSGGTATTNSGSSVGTQGSNVPPSSGGTTVRTGVSYYTPSSPPTPDISIYSSTILTSIPGISTVTPGYKSSDPGSVSTTPGQLTTKISGGTSVGTSGTMSGTTSAGGATTAPPAVKASAVKNSFVVTSIFVSIFTTIFIFKSLIFI